jgi:hypothetical protein
MLADPATIDAADRAARIWVAEEKELPIGSEAHKAAVCHRRFAGSDKRLLRPTTMPNMVRFARRFMRVPKRKPVTVTA